MLFNFRLTPLEQVPPWSRLNNDPVLHWFGLTDGCYWLHTGNSELFRANEAFLLELNRNDSPPYVDYPVVRLWEDLLDILPAVLVPVPDILSEKMTAANMLAWRKSVVSWIESKFQDDDKIDERAEYIFFQATEWMRKRALPTSHLRSGPIIWFWNDGANVHIGWDNRTIEYNDMPVWEAQIGDWQLPVDEFLAEVKAFDSTLMQAMQVRVDQILVDGGLPGIRIDLDHLVKEQRDRSTWLEKSLDKVNQARDVDWSLIFNAVATIENEIQSQN